MRDTQENLNVTNTLVIDRWWVRTPLGSARGPWPLEQVLRMYMAGELEARSEVRPEGSQAWVLIARVLPETLVGDLDQTPLALCPADEEAIDQACALKDTAVWPLAKPWPQAELAPPPPLVTSPPTALSISPDGPLEPLGARAGQRTRLRLAAVVGATTGAAAAIALWAVSVAVAPRPGTMENIPAAAAIRPPSGDGSSAANEGAALRSPSSAVQPSNEPAPLVCADVETVPPAICTWLDGLARGVVAPRPSAAAVRQFLQSRGAQPTVGRVLDELSPAEPGKRRYLVTSQNVYGYCLSTSDDLEVGSTYVRWITRQRTPAGADRTCVAVEDAPLDGAVYALAFQRPHDPRQLAQRAVALMAAEARE